MKELDGVSQSCRYECILRGSSTEKAKAKVSTSAGRYVPVENGDVERSVVQQERESDQLESLA